MGMTVFMRPVFLFAVKNNFIFTEEYSITAQIFQV